MSRESHSIKRYFPNLDAFRFFAFFVVFISHAALFLGYETQSQLFTNLKTYVLANGDIGVSFFFVLSGFLITYILLEEKGRENKISLKKFYIRRMLRIWPVYFTALILGFFVLPGLMHFLIHDTRLPFIANAPLSVLPKYLFFLANFSLAYHGGASVLTDILWSISVEEQFYLVWPFIVASVSTKHLPKVLLGVIIFSTIYKYLHAFDGYIIAYSTFSVMSDLCIGALLGWVTYMRKDVIEKFRSITRTQIFFVYVGIIFLVVSRHWYIPTYYSHTILLPTLVALAPLFLAVLFAVLIFEQNESDNSFFKGKNLKLSTALGKISYGLYSYHMIAVALVLTLASRFSVALSYASLGRWFGFGFLSLGLTVLIAHTSFRYMESWFLSKKPH